MKNNNRFGLLLEHLMSIAEIKNLTLAHALQYDVSYVSKWITGRCLPTEKRKEDILKKISDYLALSSSTKGQKQLITDYEVSSPIELSEALYDHLESAYNYVKKSQDELTKNEFPQVYYYSELTLEQYLSKMYHPVLRKVNSLDIMAAIDILEMSREYRLQIVQIENGKLSDQRVYPNVHFSMLINLDISNWDYIYDSIFLINMLTNFSHIDFSLYGCNEAIGKLIFTVKNDFAISGMLLGSKKCMSVITSEDSKNSNIMYNNIKEMCNSDYLLFRRSTMLDMLVNREYIFSLLSPNLRWLYGHLTEHFLPEDLFDEILIALSHNMNEIYSKKDLHNIYTLTQSILQKSPIKIMIYESALSDFAISNELDFYNQKVHLSTEQKVHYLKNFLAICQKNKNIEIKLIYGRLVSDFQHIANQCVFLSDTVSYLRLDNSSKKNNLVIVNTFQMQKIFDQFYETAWNIPDISVISDKDTICTYVQNIIESIHLLS